MFVTFMILWIAFMILDIEPALSYAFAISLLDGFTFYRGWHYFNSNDASLCFSRDLYEITVSFLFIYSDQYDSSIFRTTYHE